MARGILLNVHGLQVVVRDYLGFNPPLQCIEYIRYSYYEGYQRVFRRQLLSA
jgi:hypothetical protein